MMAWWRRTFGLHPIDVIAHFVVGGFLLGALDEWQHTDAITLVGVAAMFGLFAWRRHRALAALPPEGMTSGEVKLAELDAQAEELHEMRTRVAELEERVDFAERMLAKQREPEQLPRG
jgi:hypothetical protein